MAGENVSGSLHSASVAMAPSSSVEMTKRGLRSRAKQNRCCRRSLEPDSNISLELLSTRSLYPSPTPGEGADHSTCIFCLSKDQAAEIVSDTDPTESTSKKGGGLDKRKRERMGILSKLSRLLVISTDNEGALRLRRSGEIPRMFRSTMPRQGVLTIQKVLFHSICILAASREIGTVHRVELPDAAWHKDKSPGWFDLSSRPFASSGSFGLRSP